MSVASLLTHAHGLGVRWRRRRPLEPLGAPVVSVGNIAFGGRAKTPLVAALAALAQREGLRPAIATRGYGRRSRARLVVVGEANEGPVWARPLRVGRRSAPACMSVRDLGDEAAWLAATLPGVPVAVGADRRSAAQGLPPHDLLLLDDGFQHPLPRAVDVVVIRQDDLDGGLTREPSAALRRAHLVLRLGEGGDLQREPAGVRALIDGRPAAPGPVRLLCGVGDPGSVATLSRDAGFPPLDELHLGDHRAPGRWRRSRLRPGLPWLVTEKDAVGWAARRPPPGSTLVLGMRLRGVESAWVEIGDRLGGAGG